MITPAARQPRRLLAGVLLGTGIAAAVGGLVMDAEELLWSEGNPSFEMLLVGVVAVLLGLGLMGLATKVGR